MGSVLLATDAKGNSVVLKIPHHVTPEVTARMEDEARIGMQLRHPYIVRTLDYFVDEQRPVIVIGHIEGTSLRELRDTVGALPPAMVARVGEQISDALSALHHLKDNDGRSLEILHRDVTPGNILVDRRGNACLIDLGIARSVMSKANKTAVGILRGTFRYISPDLFAGKAYSWMTDLWALGVTLFEASVGRKAVEGNEHTVFGAIMGGKLTHLRNGESLNPALRYLFDGLLTVDAEARRFRDPEDVLHAFRVIRGRLGDGEQACIDVMASVPVPMDEEAMEPTAIAPAIIGGGSAMPAAGDVASDGSGNVATAAPPPGISGDEFAEHTLVTRPIFHAWNTNTGGGPASPSDDYKTINTGFRASELSPAPLNDQDVPTSKLPKVKKPPPPLGLRDDQKPTVTTQTAVIIEENSLDFDED